MTNREKITQLIKKYDLHADDVYPHKAGFKVIKRRGYKRIQAKLYLEISFHVPHASADFAVVIAEGQMPVEGGDGGYVRRSTIGEVSPRNSTFEYPVNVAQKRAEGRLILEMANLYEEGYLTEDEIDESVKSKALIKKNEQKGKDSNDATKKALGI